MKAPPMPQFSVLLSHGFRLLFPAAALFAALAMGLWIAFLTVGLTLPSAFAPLDWHAHAFLWGYLGAAVAGFLLTAGANWTGRPPVSGPLLALLVGLWLAGRGVMLLPAGVASALPWGLVMVVDLSFLAAVLAVMGRDIVLAKNWRNLVVLALIALFLIANALFHIEAAQGHPAASGYGLRLGVAALLMLVVLVGGRIVPRFTLNWLMERGPGRLPIQFNTYDKAVLLLTVLTLASWVVGPQAMITGGLCLVMAVAHLVRLLRWTPWRTGSEPLMWSLHVGMLFIPLGFALIGGAILWPQTIPASGAQHAWMAGAFAVMTAAVMSRATLGHTGRPLVAGPGFTLVYLALIGATLARIIAGFIPSAVWLLHMAATAWIVGFVLFLVLVWPMVSRPRVRG